VERVSGTIPYRTIIVTPLDEFGLAALREGLCAGYCYRGIAAQSAKQNGSWTEVRITQKTDQRIAQNNFPNHNSKLAAPKPLPVITRIPVGYRHPIVCVTLWK
jgi:hypothetical protein